MRPGNRRDGFRGRSLALLLTATLTGQTVEAAFSAKSRVATTSRVTLAAANTNVSGYDRSAPLVYALEVDTASGDRIRPDRTPAHTTTWSFRVNGGSWTVLSTSSSPAKLVAAGAAGMVDGTTVTSGERIVGSACGTYIAALKEHESSNPLETATGSEVRDGECTETQASIDLSAATPGSVFEFKIDQIHDTGTATLIGTATVTIANRRVMVVQ